ncbi:hypothetical protein PTTG_05361, partial [Puccinia triticina 1-1 BBBD Race 1]
MIKPKDTLISPTQPTRTTRENRITFNTQDLGCPQRTSLHRDVSPPPYSKAMPLSSLRQAMPLSSLLARLPILQRRSAPISLFVGLALLLRLHTHLKLLLLPKTSSRRPSMQLLPPTDRCNCA